MFKKYNPVSLHPYFYVFVCFFLGSCMDAPENEYSKTAVIKEIKDTIPATDDFDIYEILENTFHFHSREEWKAVQPIKEMTSHSFDKITIHHSAVKYKLNDDPIKKMKSLQRFSHEQTTLGNGNPKEVWADVPYHFIIYPKGQVAEGRDMDFAGDTNTEYNPVGHLLINVEGNFEEQEPTGDQLESLVRLCSIFCKLYNIHVDSINGHGYYAATKCPGQNLLEELNQIKDKVSENLNDSSDNKID